MKTCKQLDQDYVLAVLKEWSTRYHVDKRVFDAVRNATSLSFVRLETLDDFLSLIWQEIDDSRLLTPPGLSRTLRDVAQRMLANDFTFERLAAHPRLPHKEYNPQWFKNCLQIDRDFTYEHFGWIAVVEPTQNERTQSPTGSHYIYDGVHKSLVLAKRLLSSEIDFQPLEAILILPRPSEKTLELNLQIPGIDLT